jgi:hypothetical protein
VNASSYVVVWLLGGGAWWLMTRDVFIATWRAAAQLTTQQRYVQSEIKGSHVMFSFATRNSDHSTASPPTSLHYHITTSPQHLITLSSYHHITTSPHVSNETHCRPACYLRSRAYQQGSASTTCQSVLGGCENTSFLLTSLASVACTFV